MHIKQYTGLVLHICCSVAKLCPNLWDPMNWCTPGLSVLHYLWVCPNMSTESMMPSNPLILCGPLLLPPSIFPSIRVFSMSQFFALGGQSIGASASASVLPMNIQGWFPLRLTGLISLLCKGLSRVFSSTTVRKHQFFSAQSSLWPNSSGSLRLQLGSPLHICTSHIMAFLYPYETFFPPLTCENYYFI